MTRVVFYFGPPGAGKDTQADFVIKEKGFRRVPSSVIIKNKFAENPNDPVIAEQIKRVKAGKLNDPVLTGAWIIEYIESELAKDPTARFAFSGSPRTVAEAKVELAKLDALLGVENMVGINLILSKEETFKRILGRRFCRANDHPFPGTPEFADLKVCPEDGSELYVRDLDRSELLEIRYKEYLDQTVPTIEIVRASGMPFYDIDGEQSIQAIKDECMAIVERRLSPAPIK